MWGIITDLRPVQAESTTLVLVVSFSCWYWVSRYMQQWCYHKHKHLSLQVAKSAIKSRSRTPPCTPLHPGPGYHTSPKPSAVVFHNLRTRPTWIIFSKCAGCVKQQRHTSFPPVSVDFEQSSCVNVAAGRSSGCRGGWMHRIQISFFPAVPLKPAEPVWSVEMQLLNQLPQPQCHLCLFFLFFKFHSGTKVLMSSDIFWWISEPSESFMSVSDRRAQHQGGDVSGVDVSCVFNIVPEQCLGGLNFDARVSLHWRTIVCFHVRNRNAALPENLLSLSCHSWLDSLLLSLSFLWVFSDDSSHGVLIHSL